MSKIIQIMPADGWWVRYFDEDLSNFYYRKCVCIALHDTGDLCFMSSYIDGEVYYCSSPSLEIIYSKDDLSNKND